MSVTFRISNHHMVPYEGREVHSGSEFRCPTCNGTATGGECERPECFMGRITPTIDLNLANPNAIDLLVFLGIMHPWSKPDALIGQIRSIELRKRIEAATVKRDKGRPAEESPRVHNFGREPERMTRYLDRLLELCDRADELGVEGVIRWD